jgi:hypothetical protein
VGPNRLKYLDLIQAIISRLAGNQFTLRTWSVGLGSAIIGYAATKDAHVQAAYLGSASAVIFWILDAYYLGLERAYRHLYNQECVKADDTPTMSLKVNPSVTDYLTAWTRPAVWFVHLPVFFLGLFVGGRVWPR